MNDDKTAHQGNQNRGSAKKEVDPQLAAQVTNELIERVVAEAVNGKISCARARALANELGVPSRVVGHAAGMGGVRIGSCELGCF